MDTELPEYCYYTYIWHEGYPEARAYPRKSKEHITHSERFESGFTYTSCERCGCVACDY